MRRLVKELLLCIKIRPTKSSRNFSPSDTSSGSFPIREVTFHIHRASFCSRGLGHQDPCLRLLPNRKFTQPLWRFLQVVNPREGGPMLPFWTVPSWTPIVKDPATRCSLACPTPRPGFRRSPGDPRLGKGTMRPNISLIIRGLLGYTGPSPRTCLPLETLSGA